MAWFGWVGGKQRQLVLPMPDPASFQVKKTQGELWLDTATEDVFQGTLANINKEFKDINTYPDKIDKHNAEVYVESLTARIRKLDRSRMNEEHKKNLAMIIFGTFPRAVAKLETSLLSEDECEWAVEIFGETVVNMLTKFIDHMPRKIPIPNQLSVVTDDSLTKVVESVGNEAVDVRLTKVKALAAEAYKLAISSDDQFFAEQAANSYIPDSVRMFAGLTHAPEDMQEEATELFMRQLDIIETQLQAIVRKSASHSLSAMKAHTDFLESKNEGIELRE